MIDALTFTLAFALYWQLTAPGFVTDPGDELADLINEVVDLVGAGQCDRAAEVAHQALKLAEEIGGPDHPIVAVSLDSLALVYKNQVQFSLAEPLYRRALAIREKQPGPRDPAEADSLINLALLRAARCQYFKAALLYQRVLEINTNTFGPNLPHVASCLENLLELYRATDPTQKAEPLAQRASRLRAIERCRISGIRQESRT